MPVIMKDNVQYAYTTKGTVFHTLSNAEYEALTEEEKMNGDVYCIPDREPVINPDQLWEKVGTGTLDIGDDLTDGVNQLNSSLTNTNTNLQNLITQIGAIHWIGVTNIYNFLRNTDNPSGLYLAGCQNASDNPFSGNVSLGLIYKASANGSYSVVFIIAGNRLAISDQLGTSQTALTWHSKVSPFG